MQTSNEKPHRKPLYTRAAPSETVSSDWDGLTFHAASWDENTCSKCRDGQAGNLHTLCGSTRKEVTMKATELADGKVDMFEQMITTFLISCMRVFSERLRLQDVASRSAILSISDQMQPVPVTYRKSLRYLDSCHCNSTNTLAEDGRIYSKLPTRRIR